MTGTDEMFMKRCIELAINGMGHVAPNPMVGCVIVYEGKIIGEGYHREFGGAHAEVNAINAVKEKHKLKKSTLYVNLEPCSHYGKTPPCADLIIKHKIPRVVIAHTDIHKLVSGKGIEKLSNAGCEVTTNVLAKEALFLNRRFNIYHTKKRPYLILKWAQTTDGFIDIDRNNDTPVKPTWITSERTRIIVHKWRTEESAIIVGTNTALKDNPSLTARAWTGKNPLRIVIDEHNRLPKNLNIFNNEAPTLIFNASKNAEQENLEFIIADFEKDLLEHILNVLCQKQIISLIVEGGTQLIQSFIDNNLWDEARIFTGDTKFLSGVKAPSLENNKKETFYIGTDTLDICFNNEHLII